MSRSFFRAARDFLSGPEREDLNDAGLWQAAGTSEFVLDREENPHPRMLGEALLARASAFDSTEAMAYWLGYRAAMCGATGCPPTEIDAWMDHHEPGVAVEIRQ